MYYYRNVTDIVVIVIFKTLHFWKLYIKKLYRSKIRPTVTGTIDLQYRYCITVAVRPLGQGLPIEASTGGLNPHPTGRLRTRRSNPERREPLATLTSIRTRANCSGPGRPHRPLPSATQGTTARPKLERSWQLFGRNLVQDKAPTWVARKLRTLLEKHKATFDLLFSI